jgi:hypothetical protein
MEVIYMLSNDWKVRAIERRYENKELKKRNNEITASRDKWKAKYMSNKSEVVSLRAQMDSIKKKINQIIEM